MQFGENVWRLMGANQNQWRQFLWGWGGSCPPHFLEKSTKSQTFLSVFTPELLWITLKSHTDLVSAPPLFFENDAPADNLFERGGGHHHYRKKMGDGF